MSLLLLYRRLAVLFETYLLLCREYRSQVLMLDPGHPQVGWIIPVGALAEEVSGFTDLPEGADDTIEDDAELVANFFSKTCAPRAVGNGPQNSPDGEGQLWKEGLCTGCTGECTTKNIYYGDTGAFRCLSEEQGDVAFVKHTTVLNYASDGSADETLRAWSKKPMSDFKLLCRDGGCADVDDYKTCHLAATISHGLISSPAISSEGAEAAVGKAVQDAIISAGEDFVKETSALIAGTDFLWSAGTKDLVPLNEDYLETLAQGEITETVNAFQSIVSKGTSVTVRVCVPYAIPFSSSIAFLRKCTTAVGLANTPELEFICVAGESTSHCQEMMENGIAHITTMDGGEIYSSGFSENSEAFNPIIIEETGEDTPKGTHYSVAVVPKEFCEGAPKSLANLQGKNACFSGFQKMAGWYVPVGSMVQEADEFLKTSVPSNNVELDALLVGGFFSKVCAPGLGLNGPDFTSRGGPALWDGLCSSCQGDCSTKDIYYGDQGAFRCLSEGNGDVAFVTQTTVLKYAADGSVDETLRSWSDKDMSEFRLLCKTGGCDTVENYAECNLGLAPGRALVVEPSLADGGPNEEIGIAIHDAILKASKETDFLKETRELRNNFLWSHEAKSLSSVTKKYLAAEVQGAVSAFDSIFLAPAQGGETATSQIEEIDGPAQRKGAIFCAKNEREMKFCRKFERLLSKQHPEFAWGCHEESSTEACLQAIASGTAHWKTVDVSDLYLGFTKYGLRAVVAEDRGQGVGASYFSVAIVHDRICKNPDVSLSDLKGKKSCHTGYRKASGWDIPVGTLISTRVMKVVDNIPNVENDAESAADFFSNICAARTSDNGPMNSQDGLGFTWNSLCTGCKGDCSNNEIYYGYEGAFRCFAEEAGDVMFTRHNAIPEDAGLVAPSLNLTSLKLLCKDKPGCYDLDDFASCHLARVPAPAVLVKYNTDLTKGSFFQNALVAASKTDTFAELVFNEKRNPSNFIFSNDVSRLVRIDSDMVTYLSDTDKIYRTLESIRASPDVWTEPSVIDVQTVSKDQNLKNTASIQASPTNTLFVSLLGAILLFCFLQ